MTALVGGAAASVGAPWASAWRSARVSAPHPAGSELTRLPEEELPSGDPGLDDARGLQISPNGQQVLVDCGKRFQVRSPQTGALLWSGPKSTGAHLLAQDDLCVGPQFAWTWSGARSRQAPPLTGINSAGRLLSTHLTADRRTSVVANPPLMMGESGWSLIVRASEFREGSDQRKDDLAWEDYASQRGTACVSADHHVVLALADRTFRVLAAEGHESGEAARLCDVVLPFQPGVLSLITPYALISDAEGRVLHWVDSAGEIQRSHWLPFELTQPPVDGGEDRVVLVGEEGVVSLRGDDFAWSFPVSKPQVMAFGDGDLVVCAGHELLLLSRDGDQRARFTVAETERILTPPAIDAAGAVWVATAQALYVLR